MEKHSPKDRPVAEAALESSEVIVDVLMRGEVLAEIPFIGTAIKICKAADSIQDRALAVRLASFIKNFEGISEEQKFKLREKINADEGEAKKVGETLFFVLERVTDLDKPLLLSQIFLAYVDERVSSENLRRLCQAVDTAFIDDLQQLLTTDKVPEMSKEPWMFYLVPSGLTRLVGSGMVDDAGNIYCEISQLGKKLKDLIGE